MSVFRNPSELSQTEPERASHPMKEFLGRCGVNVSEFPFVRFLIESSEKEIRSGRLYIPLRIPTEPGYIYDSVIRITRVMEIPAVSGTGHRKFFELEWEIDEHPVPEDALHDAIQFLGTEVMCPKCRELFNPDPDIIDTMTIKVECSQCLFQWMIRAMALEKADARVPLLLDLLRADPASMRRYLRQWDRQPIEPTNSLYFSYFPFHFENLEEQSSLDLLFGDQSGLVALSNGIGSDFELLAKGLLNQISLEYFKRSEFNTPTQALDKTEIQRKEETRKEDTKLILEEVPEVTPVVRVTPMIDTMEVSSASVALPLTAAPEGARILKFAPPNNLNSNLTKNKRNHLAKAGFLIAGLGSMFFIFYIVGKNLQFAAPTTSKPISTEATQAEAIIQKTVKIEEKVEAKIPQKIEEPEVLEVKKESPKPMKRAQIIREETPVKVATTAAKPTTALEEKLKTERVEAFYRQGMLHLKLQQSKEAESEFQQVIDLNPKHAPAYRGLGLAYVYDQRFSEAIHAFEKYLKITEDTFDKDSIEELIQTLRERAANAAPLAKQ